MNEKSPFLYVFNQCWTSDAWLEPNHSPERVLQPKKEIKITNREIHEQFGHISTSRKNHTQIQKLRGRWCAQMYSGIDRHNCFLGRTGFGTRNWHPGCGEDWEMKNDEGGRKVAYYVAIPRDFNLFRSRTPHSTTSGCEHFMNRWVFSGDVDAPQQ